MSLRTLSSFSMNIWACLEVKMRAGLTLSVVSPHPPQWMPSRLRSNVRISSRLGKKHSICVKVVGFSCTYLAVVSASTAQMVPSPLAEWIRPGYFFSRDLSPSRRV